MSKKHICIAATQKRNCDVMLDTGIFRGFLYKKSIGRNIRKDFAFRGDENANIGMADTG